MHVAGRLVDLSGLLVCAARDVIPIEDASHAFGSTIEGSMRCGDGQYSLLPLAFIRLKILPVPKWSIVTSDDEYARNYAL